MSAEDTIHAATVLRCVEIIHHLLEAKAPAGEFYIVEKAAAELLKLVPDLIDHEDQWLMVPIAPNRAMELAGQAALRHALGPAGMKLLIGSRPDIVQRVWNEMARAAPTYGGRDAG